LVPPVEGVITFAGRRLRGLTPAQIARLGISHVPEGRRIFSRLTVFDNLELGGYALGRSELRQQVDRVFADFPVLAERRAQYAATLSGGEQQMLALGRALMMSPKLLLLDEPSLGLAPIIVESLFELLRAVVVRGVTILLVEQNAQLALDTADRAYVLERGAVVCAGTAREIAADERVFRAYLGGELEARTEGRTLI
jgi:branched-chain amino acid transport system ATP-binding protein